MSRQPLFLLTLDPAQGSTLSVAWTARLERGRHPAVHSESGKHQCREEDAPRTSGAYWVRDSPLNAQPMLLLTLPKEEVHSVPWSRLAALAPPLPSKPLRDASQPGKASRSPMGQPDVGLAFLLTMPNGIHLSSKEGGGRVDATSKGDSPQAHRPQPRERRTRARHRPDALARARTIIAQLEGELDHAKKGHPQQGDMDTRPVVAMSRTREPLVLRVLQELQTAFPLALSDEPGRNYTATLDQAPLLQPTLALLSAKSRYRHRLAGRAAAQA